MHLYLVDNRNVKWDSWGKIKAQVVVAENKESAAKIMPVDWVYPNDEIDESSWPLTPSDLVVTYLGESAELVERSVIIYPIGD